jgi:hypothetical protein
MTLLSPDDMRLRLRRMLPARWWADEAPVLDRLLLGLGTVLSAIHELIAYARQQTRLATATAPWLDIAAQDFLGGRLLRRSQETDDAFRKRLIAIMQRPRATRDAVGAAVLRVCGSEPLIFEPRRPADTGAWNSGSIGYGAAGGWGSLTLPAQIFVVAQRPRGTGCALLSGYGTGGLTVYAGSAQIGAQVPDSEIFAAIADAMPSGAVAWTRLT